MIDIVIIAVGAIVITTVAGFTLGAVGIAVDSMSRIWKRLNG